MAKNHETPQLPSKTNTGKLRQDINFILSDKHNWKKAYNVNGIEGMKK